MNPLERPLLGLRVGVSISESEDTAALGFPPWQVNHTSLQIASALLGQGAGVVFGHDWRDDGVMEAMHSFAQQVLTPPSSAEAQVARQPLMRNILPWPDVPSLDAREVERLSATLCIERAELPAELASRAVEAASAPQTDRYRYLRARGLTHLRHRLEDASDARLCIGGRRLGYAGRYPGIVEEALFALRTSKPVYLAGVLGGAALDVINAIEGKPMPERWYDRESIEALYENPPLPETNPSTLDDRGIEPHNVWAELGRLGKNSAANSALTSAEYDELSHTPVLGRVIQLVLIGLSRARFKR